MGPAFAFDEGARAAMQKLIENGYCHGLLAGNALGTHDLEAALLHTALGQDIYTQQSQPNGHYNHLDVLNLVRASGSIPQFIADHHIDNGILYACVRQNVPFVLTSSIRDDGPLPEVVANAYEGQNAMRAQVRQATTVICLATMLHTIATGNMTPSFRVLPDRDGAPRVSLRRGRGGVRREQAARPRQSRRHDDGHERTGLHRQGNGRSRPVIFPGKGR